jgi:DGQHR domain-containing protein
MPKAKINIYKSESLQTQFNGIDVFTQAMKVKDVLTIFYVAVRGRDSEEGAVQRVLSSYRVKQIREYILQGKNFFNTFILNWTEKNHPIHFDSGRIEIPIVPSAAQVLDGQHRLGGLQAAFEIDSKIGERTILVSFTVGLKTKEAAEIFLNINTEQRPVPKSLIYDLFGVVENDKEHAVNRAKDIAIELNENEDSPYYKLIKFPGSPLGYGIVDLSSFVSTLKNYLKPNGLFFNYNITDLNRQKIIFLNYFTAIKFFYDEKELWPLKSKNPFLQSAGVVAAIEFFAEKLLLKCSDKKSFSIETLKGFLQLNKSELLTQSTVKGTDGKSARLAIKEYLENNLLAEAPEQDEYEF